MRSGVPTSAGAFGIISEMSKESCAAVGAGGTMPPLASSKEPLGAAAFSSRGRIDMPVLLSLSLIALEIQVIVTPILNLGVQTLTLSTVTITTRYTYMPIDPAMNEKS